MLQGFTGREKGIGWQGGGLKEELLVYKKEAMEQYEKRFHKAVRKVGFFVKDLDLGLFDPFKDVKDGVLLDEEEIAGEKGIVNEEQGVE